MQTDISFPVRAGFDGPGLTASDLERLKAQWLRVAQVMADGRWRTLRELALATGDPEASVSARLRDLRKPKFGGHEVERRRRVGVSGRSLGTYEYRVIRSSDA